MSQLSFINIARLHPLLVHLPIGILILTYLLELANRYWKRGEYVEAIKLGHVFSVAGCIVTTITGLLLSNEGGYEGSTIIWHRNVGIAVTVLSLCSLYLNQTNRSSLQQLYFPVFSVLVGSLFAVGHLGGNLTHGSDYLFSYPSDEVIVIQNIDEAPLYHEIIYPILDQRCVGCHNTSKLKGDLLMTTEEGLLKGGKTGPIFDLENPEQSELLRRMHLPKDDKKHMPPKGKSQLTPDEVQLLGWWVDNKACFDCAVGELSKDEPIEQILAKYTFVQEDQIPANVAFISEQQRNKLTQKGLDIHTMDPNSPLVEVSFLNDKSLDKSKIKALKSIAENVSSLSFAGSSLTTQLFKSVPKLPNLQKLELQRTAIDDDVARGWSKFENLRTLNLYNTGIGDEALSSLSELKLLKNIYLYETMVTATAVAQLEETMPLAYVSWQIDADIFGEGKLGPPSFDLEADLFVDTLRVPLSNTFRNVTIHYTLDGSEPDSTSQIYTEPILLIETTLIKALSRKEGWGASAIGEKRFIQTNVKAQDIALAVEPNRQYKGKGPSTIIDLVKGTEDFRDGNWLGFEANDLQATMELPDATDVKSIYVSCLSEPGSWIFYPEAISVSLSVDGVTYTEPIEMDTKLDHRVGKEIKYIEVPVTGEDIKYVKVDVHNIMQNPDWHPNPGGKSWVFVDEIMIN